MRVLLVEDDADLAGVVLEALREDGHQATHVRGPAEACRLASTDPWDAFVVDAFGRYDRPDPEYRATLRHLANHGRVVVTTGRVWANYADPDELGAAAVLSKPYDLEDLTDALTSSAVAAAP